MQPPVRRAVAGALLASSLLLLVGAAASAQVATLEEPGASPAASAPAATTEEVALDDPQEAMLAFARCMRDHDIDMDDPQFAAGGRGFFVRLDGSADSPPFDPESEEFQIAQQACGSILEAARPQLDPEAQAEFLEQQLAMAQCLRDNGIDGYPDPVLDTDGRLQRFDGPGAGELPFDPASDEFRAARETCAAQLGVTGGPGGPPPGETP
jgi:hypothetical protein